MGFRFWGCRARGSRCVRIEILPPISCSTDDGQIPKKEYTIDPIVQGS